MIRTRSTTVSQIVSYKRVCDELQETLDRLCENNCEVVSIHETKVSNSPGNSDQGFIIIYKYDDGTPPIGTCKCKKDE